MWFFYYFTIGVLLMFLIDFSTDKHREELEIHGVENPEYNWIERMFIILTWPIVILIVIKNLFNH